MQRRCNASYRNSSRFAAALVIFCSLAFPARADIDVTGTYRIVTGTGKHMIVTLIETDDNTVDGMYAGSGPGVAGRLHGSWNHDFTMMSYTWEERASDSDNGTAKGGWGNMTWNESGTRMQARWGFTNQGTSVGLWNAVKLDP